MKTQIIKVHDLTNDYAIDASIGSKLFEIIENYLTQDVDIIIDFENVNVVLSVFLHAAISGFYASRYETKFEEKVKTNNLSKSAQILWDRVIKSAKTKASQN